MRDTFSIDLLREGSEPSQFDIEYEIGYSAVVELGRVEPDDIVFVRYYESDTAPGRMIEVATLSASFRARVDALIQADARAQSAALAREADRDDRERQYYGDT